MGRAIKKAATEKLRHINKRAKKTKEREDCIITKHFIKKLHEEILKKVKRIYQNIQLIFYPEFIMNNNFILY